MPHLVERDDDWALGGGGLGNVARCGSDPVENRDVADAQQPGDRAKTHVTHRVEQHRKRLHRRRFAARRRLGEIASTGLAAKPLDATHDTIPHMIGAAAALATNLCHGTLVFRLLPETCQGNG